MRTALVLCVLALAACGADGEPIAPENATPAAKPGISVGLSGTAKMGISG